MPSIALPQGKLGLRRIFSTEMYFYHTEHAQAVVNSTHPVEIFHKWSGHWY